MDRRSVVSLAAVILGGLAVSGCMEAPRNDGRMFQRWAQAVVDIPTSDEEALARDRLRARQTLAEADVAASRAAPVTLTAEAAGLRPAMTIKVVDPLELPAARDIGLRAAMDAAGSLAGADRQATVQRASLGQASPAGPWIAQIAAFRSQADAEAQWRKLKAVSGSALSGVTPRFEPVDLGAKGRWVRLKAPGLPSRAAAAAVCRAAGVTDEWCVKPA
ncbi:MAG: SPOR domain-containing protein [Caulobacteraceae bacterium]|nr:SPOR domain-containing protein [Caulobacteraceae bacterium]